MVRQTMPLRQHANNAARRKPSVARMMQAVRKKEIEQVALQLSLGADPNHRNNRGRRPLEYASLIGPAEMLRLLLDAGADPNKVFKPQAAGKTGNTALINVIRRGDLDSAKVLLMHGADIDGRNGEGDTPLIAAAQAGRADIAAHLAAAGANIYLKDRRGETAYEAALRRGHRAVAVMLGNIISRDRARERQESLRNRASGLRLKGPQP